MPRTLAHCEGPHRIAQSSMMGTTLTIERIEKRGYQFLIQYYEQLFHGKRTA